MTKNVEPFTSYVLLEGSSTLVGIGDEEGRQGYAGRIKAHYARYWESSVRLPERPACFWVAVHGDGAIDYDLTQYAPHFGAAADLAAAKNKLETQPQKGVAICLFGNFLGRILRTASKEYALAQYGEALDTLQTACEQRELAMIGLGTPMPVPGYRFPNGGVPNREMRRRTTDLAEDHLSTWSVPTEMYRLDDLASDADQRAADGAHLNARGYGAVALHLIPRIDSILGIDSTPALVS